jgi:copper(I)-binding protein/uncharacterized protein YcnI
MKTQMRIGLAILLPVLAAGSASAHVTLADPKAAPGAYYVSFFRVGHGCAGSATTALRIEVPDRVPVIRPQPKAGWTIEIERAPLNPPVKGEGGKMLTERVKAITWRGGPLPDEDWDQFGVSAKLPDTLGKLYFPAVQTCEVGEARWVEVPAADKPGRLQHPAPAVEIAADAGGDDMAGMDMSGMDMGGAKAEASSPAAGRAKDRHGRRAGVEVINPWIAPPPQGAPTAAGYLTIRNGGAEADALVGASTPSAEKLELHSMTMTGGVMRMRPITSGLAIPAGKIVVIGPNAGYHLMLIRPNRVLKPGDRVPATLRFAKAGAIPVTFVVGKAP